MNTKKRPLAGIMLLASTICLGGVTPSADAAPPGTASLVTPTDTHRGVVLADWREDQTLVFTAGDGVNVEVPAEEVVRYGSGAAPRVGQGVVLVDGSLVIGRVLRMDQQTCELAHQYGYLTVPRPLVRAVMFNAWAVEGFQQDFLRAAMAFESGDADDRLVRIDGDYASGTLVADASGIVFDRGSVESVRIDVGDQRRSEPIHRLRGIVLSPLVAPWVTPSGAGVRVGTADGSRWAIQRLDEEGDAGWRLELACGLEVALRPDRFSLEEIQFVGAAAPAGPAELQRLNRQRPLRSRWVPLVGAATVADGRLAWEGERSEMLPVWRGERWYAEGLVMPVGSQIVYPGGEAPRRFRASVGLAGEIEGTASRTDGMAARMRLRVASSNRVEDVWDSGPIEVDARLLDVDVVIPASAAVILDVESLAIDAQGIVAQWIDPVLTEL